MFQAVSKWCSALTIGSPAWNCKRKPGACLWLLGPFLQCSASCGEGVQTRTVTCRTQQGSQAEDFSCLMEPKPSATQPCLKENCIQEIGWHVGDWGLVSTSLSWLRNYWLYCCAPHKQALIRAVCTLAEAGSKDCFITSPLPHSCAVTGTGNAPVNLMPAFCAAATKINPSERRLSFQWQWQNAANKLKQSILAAYSQFLAPLLWSAEQLSGQVWLRALGFFRTGHCTWWYALKYIFVIIQINCASDGLILCHRSQNAFNLGKLSRGRDMGTSNASGDFQTHFFSSALARPACSELKHVTSASSWDVSQILVTAKEASYLNLIFLLTFWYQKISNLPLWIREKYSSSVYRACNEPRGLHAIPSSEPLLPLIHSFQWGKLQLAA